MSKVKKKPIIRQKSTTELDVKFEKIIQFSGWLFILALAGLLGGWVLFDNILEMITLELDALTFSIIIFTGTNAAISFGLASKIKNNRDKKREYFLDWIIGEFLFCMFAIFAIAAYQW
jgi:hypothetical protein